MKELGPNPLIYPISSSAIRSAASAPEYIRFGTICMALSYRLNQTRGGAYSPSYSGALAEKFYSYWGLAVRSLNEQLDVKHGLPGDVVLAGVLTLLLTDVS